MDKPGAIIVAVSCGKDSLATLDICAKEFSTVKAFFGYWVKGLEFQEATLQWAEARYGIQIVRVPHYEIFAVTDRQALNIFRPSQKDIPRVSRREYEDHLRRKLGGVTWIASGEKKQDSLQRRGMLSAAGQWDIKRLHYYPVLDWSNRQVFTYLKANRIPLPAEYAYLRGSWRGMRGDELDVIKRQFPGDYARILEVFPMAEAIRKRHELYGQTEAGKTKGRRRKKQTPAVHDGNDEPVAAG